jgi:SpoVK/Ycf46/Vps4 family AAA+-type ATPase
MKIPRIRNGLGSNTIHLNSDKNEQFILKNCVKYLQRHFKRYPSFDNETLKIIVWTLWKEIEHIFKFLTDEMDKTQKIKFKEELYEIEYETDDYTDFISRIVKNMNSSRRNRFARQIINLLDNRHRCPGYRGKAEIEKNVSALKKMFNLTEQEVEFIVFLFILTVYENPQDFFVTYLACNKIVGRKYLTNILGLSKVELNGILSGTLKEIGFFEMDRFDLQVEDDFLGLFQNPSDQKYSQQFYLKIPPGTVPLDHYFISTDERNHILSLLEKKPKTSTHILLYGPPGTGKTSFVYSLADRLGIPGYEIVRDEANITRNRRAAILACLNMTDTGKGSLIVLDEADNLLNTKFSYFIRGETQDKGWLNELLEKPGTRMIWITNSIGGIEESVLRRFAFSLHFKPFNRRQRSQLWENILHRNKANKFFSPSDVKAFAKKHKVNAGVIDLAVKKSIEMYPGSKTKFQRTVELALEAHETLSNNGEKSINKDQVEKNYSLEGLNIKGDLASMMTQLENFDSFLRNSRTDQIMNMNLLFYGPPGTGKSELARYIAGQIDREIICKRISDLQSKYVGDGEKNIKRAFQEAEAEESILIIDEADSLLFNRERAERSWEISFTNEFLTQMERFRGILICTTNRLKDLDDASIRRFNQKIGFDQLLPEGNVIFYEKLIGDITNLPVDNKTRSALKSLKGLTPGDFKTVRDRFSFHPREELNHQILVHALKEEGRIKNAHKKNTKIGF